MIKINHKNFIKYDIMYMKKLENLRKIKQYKQYECKDIIQQNCELHMNVYNLYIAYEMNKLNNEIYRIDKCLINLKKKTKDSNK